MSDTDSPSLDRALVIVVTEPGRPVPPGWLTRIQQHLPGRIVASGSGPAPEGVDVLPDSRGPWWTWLGDIDRTLTRNGVVVLAPGLFLPERFTARLEHALASPDCPALITLPGNHQAGLDPAAGLLQADPGALDAAVLAAADLSFTPVRLHPERLAVIPAGRVGEAVAEAEQTRCWLHDGLWIGDPEAGDPAGPEEPDLRAALGHLRAALARLSGDEPMPALPLFGFDGRPVVLHISHDWGGGVARWIEDLCAADAEHNHLVLSAGGRSDGEVHGQWLKLYAAGPGRACVRRWTLVPAIAGTEPGHDQYREILDSVIRRYGVARLVISSLIGHSLDALATGLPTVEMLHDYYPAWPVLDHDPLSYTGEDGRIDLERAIDESGDQFLFAERRGTIWRDLAAAWLASVRNHGVALAAPAGHVLDRWRRLLDDPLEDARTIPHGFAGWPAGTPAVAPRALPDGRLNLVVVGRLSPGKGLGLLEAALEALGKHARITLLGCGHHGMRFFGRRDVDIVLDYDRETLPAHLARIGAQAALFLSTVAETWNYVLTETRALGLVPIATRTGSFAERIHPDFDGVLFEPEASALLGAVRALHENPERLESLRRELPTEPTMSDMLSSLDRLGGWQPSRLPPARRSSDSELQFARQSVDAADARRQGRRLQQEIEALQRDLEQRTDWAHKHERLAAERTRWARQLDAELTEHRARIDDLQTALQAARNDAEVERARAEHLERELLDVYASHSWRVTRPLRAASRLADNAMRRQVYNPLRWPRLLSRLLHNLHRHGLRGTLDLMQQVAPPRGQQAAAFEVLADAPGEELHPIDLEQVHEPLVSIVVPVFNKVHYTSACLNSVAQQAASTPFELIVVDDCSHDETADYLARCRGIRVIRNTENSGFIASCNAGAGAARGRYLVFLNNDTTVTAGWLDALLGSFATFSDAGIVGARLVYPDGRLQEAGGIIFSDASGWNYGRGDRPDRPEYSFACEADYVSGACLAIGRELYEQLGGFDSHYAPAYYEDTDLCFRVREAGRRVIYQPACTIVHHEGISSGTDESTGTKRFQAINRDKFLARWREQLNAQPDPVSGPNALEAVFRARHHRSRGQVLVVDATTPEPDKDSGSMRLVGILTLLRESGYRVSFMPENLAWIERYTSDLQAAGIEVLHHPWVSDIEDWLAANGARLDCLLVSRHYVLEPLLAPIRRHCPDAAVVFDTVDLHFLREERMAELAGDERTARLARKTRQAELSLISQSDATLVVSPVEQTLLGRLVPDARVRVLSNIHRVHGRSRGWQERRDLVFVGGFQHPPNLDAAEWLIDEIMPLVNSRVPEVRLHIIGSRMPAALRERRGEGVIIHGYVADLAPYLEGCRLSLAPLRYGAGVKGKVNQAMAWGLPVVATSCAAEGMFLEDGEDVLIADTGEAFADAIVRAYNDEALWMKLSDGGLANVKEHFSFDAARRAITELLEALRHS